MTDSLIEKLEALPVCLCAASGDRIRKDLVLATVRQHQAEQRKEAFDAPADRSQWTDEDWHHAGIDAAFVAAGRGLWYYRREIREAVEAYLAVQAERKAEQPADVVERVKTAIDEKSVIFSNEYGYFIDNLEEVAKAAIAAMGERTVQAGSTPASPTNPSGYSVVDCRKEFESHPQFKYLDFERDHDAWDRGKYKHSHVQAIYEGFEAGRAMKSVRSGEIPVIDSLMLEIDVAKACVPFVIGNELALCVKAVLKAIRPYLRTSEPVASGDLPDIKLPAGWCTLGVGDGDGNLFVHGDYDSIKACQALILRKPEPVSSDEMRFPTAEEVEAKLLQDSRYLHEPLTSNEQRLIRDVLLLCRSSKPLKDERYKRGFDDGYDAATPEPVSVDLEAGATALCQDIKRQFGGHPIPGVPPQIDSWTATGGTLECSELAEAIAKAWGLKWK